MAGSTNFLQWDAPGNNTQNDSVYTADTMRANGAQSGPSVFASNLANKLFRQLSWFVAAFCQMMANKGYDISDANYANLVAVLMNVMTLADYQPNAYTTVPYSATANFDASTAPKFYMLMTGNVTAPTLTNLTPGQELTFMLRQDGVGGRTFQWPANVHNGGDVDTAANQYNQQKFIVWPDGSVHAMSAMLAG